MDEQTLYTIAKQAAQERKLLRIEYTDRNGVITDRRVEPYEIKPTSAGNTLWAYSIDPGSQGTIGIRKFVIFNIIKAEITEELFNPRWPILIL